MEKNTPGNATTPILDLSPDRKEHNTRQIRCFCGWCSDQTTNFEEVDRQYANHLISGHYRKVDDNA